MTRITEITKNVADTTPIYAAVGMTDLAVQKVREGRDIAAALSNELDARRLQERADSVAKQVQYAPAEILNRGLVLAARAQEQYDAFAKRGEKLVKRIRNQKATKELIAQVDNTVSAGKGAVTTVRKAVGSTQSSARATLTTGRNEAGQVAQVLAKTVEQDAGAVADAVKTSAKRTRTAARRTSTTARNNAAGVTRQTKSTATRARKSATTARKATTSAANKLGN